MKALAKSLDKTIVLNVGEDYHSTVGVPDSYIKPYCTMPFSASGFGIPQQKSFRFHLHEYTFASNPV